MLTKNCLKYFFVGRPVGIYVICKSLGFDLFIVLDPKVVAQIEAHCSLKTVKVPKVLNNGKLSKF